MSRRASRSAALALGSLALAACAVFASRPGTRLAAAQAPAPSFAYVSVWGFDDLDPQTQTLYQGLANAIAGFSGVPNARGAHYSYYNDGTTWAIACWGAAITDAAPDGNGGYNVTLTVGPNFSISPGTDVVGGYSETFHVDANGVVTYVSSQDPYGWAGGQLIEWS